MTHVLIPVLNVDLQKFGENMVFETVFHDFHAVLGGETVGLLVRLSAVPLAFHPARRSPLPTAQPRGPALGRFPPKHPVSGSTRSHYTAQGVFLIRELLGAHIARTSSKFCGLFFGNIPSVPTVGIRNNGFRRLPSSKH